MITLIYNLADTYFVGLLNQPSQTAAITVVYSPLRCSPPSLQPLWGGRRQRLARPWATRPRTRPGRLPPSPSGGGRGPAVFCALFWVFAAPILSLCGAPADTLPTALGYAKGRW